MSEKQQQPEKCIISNTPQRSMQQRDLDMAARLTNVFYYNFTI